MPALKIPPDEAIQQINERIEAIGTIERNKSGLEYYDFVRWCSKTWQVIDAIYGPGDSHSEELRFMSLQNCSCNAGTEALILAGAYHDRLTGFIDEIRSMKEAAE